MIKQEVRELLEREGVTFDEQGHATYQGEITDPYGHIAWSTGDADDFYCFDYVLLPCGYVALHSVINSETGSFIMDGDYAIVPDAEAERMAFAMVDQAWTWVYDNGMLAEVPDDAETGDMDETQAPDWYDESTESGREFIDAVKQAVAERTQTA